MNRTVILSLAAAFLALTVGMNSANAQVYYGPRPYPLPYGARPQNNGNIGAAVVGGLIAGAIVGTILSQSDSQAMTVSYGRVFDEQIADGCQIPFEGDRHSGYYEVVNQGYHPRYETCRQIRTVVLDRYGRPVPEYARRPPRFVCLNVRTNAWVDIDNRDYYVRPRPVPVPVPAPRPYVNVTVNPRPNYGPQYGPPPVRSYPASRPRPEVASPRPYGGGVTAPGVLQAVPQGGAIR